MMTAEKIKQALLFEPAMLNRLTLPQLRKIATKLQCPGSIPDLDKRTLVDLILAYQPIRLEARLSA